MSSISARPALPTRRIALRLIGAGLALGGAALPVCLAAHPLPGAVIVISVDPTRLSLTVSVPAADLALAKVGRTAQSLDESPIPRDIKQALATYFAGHLRLTVDGQTNLTLTLNRTYLERATHEHLGAFTLLVLDFSAPLASGSTVFPLTLTYDAVMHEIRNHRATVFWRNSGQEPVAIGEIRLDATTGKAIPLTVRSTP